MENLTYYMVIFFGIASVFSPCILPLLPIYLGIVTRKNRNMYIAVLSLVLGFIISFFILQILIFNFTNVFSQIIGNSFFNRILGLIIIIFGLKMLGIIKIKYFESEKKFYLSDKYDKGGYLFPIFLGVTLGLGWTPCSGPIIFTVLTYASTTKNFIEAIYLIVLYSIGFMIPFMILTYFMNKWKKHIQSLKKYHKLIENITGILICIIGILLFFNKLTFLYINI
ncbi:cytochrome c biogenesis CcdA family protein [Cetobacterium sp. SF1]|uniref:cytochrome c biogenesis CcdA family protein n=1 Tax=unclassified Cetobacterium TaxID=2630983 RepID=UPI003CF12E3F